MPYYTVAPSLDTTSAIALGCLDQISWKGKNGNCGLAGELCRPPTDDLVIRCPALCDRAWTYSLVPIGDQRIKYRLYVVGGGIVETEENGKEENGKEENERDEREEREDERDYEKKYLDFEKDTTSLTKPYRADSFACGAAVHAGIVSPVFGGCARVAFSGPRAQFAAAFGKHGTDESIAFDSFFKYSFYFKELGQRFVQCHDPRVVVLVLNVILGIPVVYLASGAVAFWTVGIVGFWTLTLATDPPMTIDASSPEQFALLLSLCFERFLPCCFIMYVLWHCSAKKPLGEEEETVYDEPERQSEEQSEEQQETSQVEPSDSTDQDFVEPSVKPTLYPSVSALGRLFLWYPLFWLGVLNNITFDRLPVDRLTIADLRAQPGALVAVLSIVGLISTCVFIQGYKVLRAGKFRKYLCVYLAFIAGLVVLAELPGLTLRVHHYILALILIPGCSTRGVTALLFQGILLGLFLSGSARWGLASIVETEQALRRDDPLGIVFPPMILGYNATSGLLTWGAATAGAAMTAAQAHIASQFLEVSLLVNDLEYFVGNENSLNLKKIIEGLDELQKLIAMEDGEFNMYLRLGRKVPGTSKYSDFGNAAVLRWPSGEFRLPPPGLT